MKLTLGRWVRLLEILLAVMLIVLATLILFGAAPDAFSSQGTAQEWFPQAVPSDLNGFLKLGVTDINTADQDALMALPAIGEVLSQRILQYREENGPFTCWEELLEVKGIGPKTLEKLHAEAYVGTTG